MRKYPHLDNLLASDFEFVQRNKSQPLRLFLAAHAEFLRSSQSQGHRGGAAGPATARSRPRPGRVSRRGQMKGKLVKRRNEQRVKMYIGMVEYTRSFFSSLYIRTYMCVVEYAIFYTNKYLKVRV